MQEAARSRYNDVLDFDSSSTILKIEWREEVGKGSGPWFYCACSAVLSPVSLVYESSKFRKLRQLYSCALSDTLQLGEIIGTTALQNPWSKYHAYEDEAKRYLAKWSERIVLQTKQSMKKTQ